MSSSVGGLDSGAAENRKYRYTDIQLFFHWSMAAIILVAIPIGIYCAYLPPGKSPRVELLDIHKSLGTTALALLLARIICRLALGEPAFREAPDRFSHAAAKSAHLMLYAFMLYMPVTGYMSSAAGGYSLPWFGRFSWPRRLPHDKPFSQLGQWLHHLGAWGICALVAAHLAAVVWHRWVKRDEVLGRMLPFAQRRGR